MQNNEKKVLIISLPEYELSFFENIIKDNADSIELSHVRYLSGTAIAQIILDASVAVSGIFLTSLGLYLTNKSSKKQLELKEKELELKANELKIKDNKLSSIDSKVQNENLTESRFEIKVINGTQRLYYSNDDLDTNSVEKIMSSITKILKQ